MTKILYHPRFEPSQSWLRAMLLFYDTVNSIVPEGAPYEASPGINELCEKVPDAFVPLAPTKQDLEYEWTDYHALLNVLRELSDRSEGINHVSAHFDWPDDVPRLDLGKGVRVHTDKMADMLVHDLIDLELAERTADPDWLRVDRRVADLVLAMLANRMIINRPDFIGTASDRETCFAVAAKSALMRDQSWNVEAILASAVLTAEIPARMADLPLDRYLDIRRHYEEKREVFRLAMHELHTLYVQGSFQDPDEFNKKIDSVVALFAQQMQVLREGRFGRQVRRWTPVAIGGIVSIAAAAIPVPIVGMFAAGITLALTALQTAQGAPSQGTNIAQAQALLVNLDSEPHWNRGWLGRVFL